MSFIAHNYKGHGGGRSSTWNDGDLQFDEPQKTPWMATSSSPVAKNEQMVQGDETEDFSSIGSEGMISVLDGENGGSLGLSEETKAEIEANRARMAHEEEVAAANEGIPTQAQVRGNKSIFGSVEKASSKLVSVATPYQMYYGKSPTTIRCHKEIADRVANIFAQTRSAYTDEEIEELGLNKYSGCYNNRSVRNGSAPSMHAWGIAIDIDGARNPNSSNGKEPLARPEAKKFWDIVEANGGHSFGRENGRDWMHFQFAKFK